MDCGNDYLLPRLAAVVEVMGPPGSIVYIMPDPELSTHP